MIVYLLPPYPKCSFAPVKTLEGKCSTNIIPVTVGGVKHNKGLSEADFSSLESHQWYVDFLHSIYTA
jgi:hypothetical protein